MADVVATLVDMGFPKDRVELAVSKTGSQDVQTVMDWMLSHENELETAAASTTMAAEEVNHQQGASTAEPTPESISNLAAPENGATLVAKSIKCEDCGKLFKTNEEVEFHASKSGHENFSESTEEKKPLTEEEKKEQLAKIEAKLKQRRLEREAREKQEALEREKSRIKSGKEILEAKKKHEELEMKKIIEQRKKEKEEERLARQRVKNQIEADKLARKAKFGGATQEKSVEPQPAPVVAEPAVKKPTPTYNEVKLQIRLADGKTLVQNFGIKEPLSAVRLYIEMNKTDGDYPFKLMTSFPRKIFNSEDYDKPLDTLGLAPTATLIVSKS
ncbi:UBX domain-containing protein 1-B [Anthonomus grandis grandis]|uniref:UBX domain-containing protein 1-B n=1 Tax=Anthonomus grandis grandis TaxID=2921223 RepID=UPI002166A651|nr:UBX domain-containing protein 1-B [Anthonomus grandis grandis]